MLGKVLVFGSAFSLVDGSVFGLWAAKRERGGWGILFAECMLGGFLVFGRVFSLVDGSVLG